MSSLSVEQLDEYMQEALREAQKASVASEVPVGAVLVANDTIIARAHNLTESAIDASAHAELLAMREGAQKLKNWRLADCALFVTMEPCSMCGGAIKLFRVPTLVYGVSDARAGAVESLYDLLQDERTGAAPRVIRGVREIECRAILQEFFRKRR